MLLVCGSSSSYSVDEPWPAALDADNHIVDVDEDDCGLSTDTRPGRINCSVAGPVIVSDMYSCSLVFSHSGGNARGGRAMRFKRAYS